MDLYKLADAVFFGVQRETPGGKTQNRGCPVHFVKIRQASPLSRNYLQSYELGIVELQSTFNVRKILTSIGTDHNTMAQGKVAILQPNFKENVRIGQSGH